MTPAEVADLLESSGQGFVSTLHAVSPEMAAWRPKPNEWCVNEVVGHVIEAEKRGFAGRIRIILGAHEPALQKWDSAAVAAARNDCERDPKELSRELAAVRRESVELVRALKPEQMQRGGMHPEVGRLTVEQLLHEWVHHDGNHLRQALANVQACVWPHMGNTRRFTRLEQ